MVKIKFHQFTDKWLAVLIGILCVLLTSLAVLRSDFFRPHDYTHAARIVEMQRSLESGEFPVRWSANFGFGYGMPLFNFYAPFPYYLAQVPNWLFGAIISIKFLYIYNAILAFIGMYLLSKEFWGKQGGIVSGIIFSFATYRAVDLYVRGAIGEVFAMVAIPFALAGIVYIEQRKKGASLWLAISIAVTLTSHNLLGLILLPLLFLFSILLSVISTKTAREKMEFIKIVVLSVVLGIGLSAFYVLPAYFEKGFTRVEQTITTGDFDFHHHFVALRQLVSGKWGYGGSVPGLDDGLSFSLGRSALIVAVLSSLVVWIKGSSYSKRLWVVLLFVFSVFTWLTTSKSLWVWEHLSMLRFLQFPWRLLAFSHVFLALLGGGVVALQGKKTASIIVVVVLLVFGVAQSRLFVPEVYISDLSPYYRTDAEFIKNTLSLTLNDYLPPEIVGTHYPVPSNSRLVISSGDGSVTLIQEKPSSVLAKVNCSATCTLDIHNFTFPGWRAYLNGVSLPLQSQADTATYRLQIPKGDHEVLIRLERTQLRGLAELISIVSWITFAIALLHLKRLKK